MTPPVTLRMTLFIWSLMKRSPEASTATPNGWFNSALVAAPLSPLKPALPVPATTVITPLFTLRTQLFKVSAMYRLPAESRATPEGLFNGELAAEPFAPLKPAVPVPATTVKRLVWAANRNTEF